MFKYSLSVSLRVHPGLFASSDQDLIALLELRYWKPSRFRVPNVDFLEFLRVVQSQYITILIPGHRYSQRVANTRRLCSGQRDRGSRRGETTFCW